MSFRSRAYGVLRWFSGADPGTLYPLDANSEEFPLAVGTDGQVLTADSTADAGMSWQTPGASSADVTPALAEASGLRGQIAAKADLVSPNFRGTPTKNGVALATLSDITGASGDSDQVVLPSQIFGA